MSKMSFKFAPRLGIALKATLPLPNVNIEKIMKFAKRIR